MHNPFNARTSIEKIGSAPLGPYKVEVWGEPPMDYTRIYTIKHHSPEDAAREAIELFTADINKLVSPDPK
jgi:hypothetical protein